MLKNNKGFMLIEVIVVSAVIMTVMVVLYASFNKLYNNYRTKISYYDLDSKYVTKEMINFMLERNIGNINKFIKDGFGSNTYGYLVLNNVCLENLTPANCSKLQEIYRIENMLIVNYNSTSLESLKNMEINQTFRDYIEYLITYYEIKEITEDYSYIILTETKNGKNNYYANLRMR